MSAARGGAAAALVYLAVALWALRVVLPAPASTLPYSTRLAPDPASAIVSHSDQMFVTWGVARNARTFLTRPHRLWDGEQCHPVPNAVTLGESMFGDGLLGAVPWALTRDPILTMNAVSVMVLWLPALAMYALVRHLTGSAGAAFLAGLVFGFHPTRVMDPGHPFVYGNHWTPLALLFAHRLFERASWWDAAGLALFVGLQLLESFYQIVALALLGGVVGVWLLVHHRRRLPRVLPKLAAVALVVAVFAAALTRPYLETRSAWSLAGRFSFLHLPSQFAPGGFAYPGTVLVVLALVALAGRARGRAPGPAGDPRLAYLVAGLAVFWLVVFALPIPGLGITIPSLTVLAAPWVPGLDAVRGLQYARMGIYLAGAVLAGWGAVLLVRRGGAAVTAPLAAVAFLEVFAGPLARRAYGSSVALQAYPVRPDARLIALLERLPEGAVLDLPLELNLAGELRDMAHFLLLAAFHDHRVAACYNSYKLPVLNDIEGLARRLGEPGSADALAALGFGVIVVHGELEPERVRPSADAVARLVADGRLTPVGEAAGHAVYRLASPLPVEPGFAALSPAPVVPGPILVSGPRERVEFLFRNGSAATYRHPDPILPTPVVVRWYGAGGGLVAEDRMRALLPLALAPGATMTRTLEVSVPAGTELAFVTLAAAADPGRVLALRVVRGARS